MQQHIILSSESETASTHNCVGKILTKLIYNTTINVKCTLFGQLPNLQFAQKVNRRQKLVDAQSSMYINLLCETITQWYKLSSLPTFNHIKPHLTH